MPGLERLRLSSKRSEASSLLAVDSADALRVLDADAAWWTCHDEGDLDAMVSIVAVSDDEWHLHPVRLETEGRRRTDAEALARHGDTVFVFGSSFTDKSGAFDERRAFVARFSEAATVAGSEAVEVVDLGTTPVDLAARALVGLDLLDGEDDAEALLINIEGAGFIGADLVLGLRWPVSANGQPLLVVLTDAAEAMTAPDWDLAEIAQLHASAHVIDVDASPKRPAGVRGMTVTGNLLHLVVGQTERDLAAKKVKAAAARHVSVQLAPSSILPVVEIEQFEGFRKVEGVAPGPAGGWLYALDDEDAVVLVHAPG